MVVLSRTRFFSWSFYYLSLIGDVRASRINLLFYYFFGSVRMDCVGECSRGLIRNCIGTCSVLQE